MGFVKSPEEVAKLHQGPAEFHDAEMLTVFFLTRPEVSQRLVPPPLKPAAMPMGCVFLANYPRTNFGITYLESALLLAADFEGETGLYCLSMPVTDDMALILGREKFGFPKKMASIQMTRDGGEMGGWVERHGVRLVDIRARLTGRFNDEAAQEMLKTYLGSDSDAVIFNYKYFPAPSGKGFDYNPRLIREVVKLNRTAMELGQAEVVLGSSPHDPWGEVEIVKVLGATYTLSHNTMLPGAVVAEARQDEFVPYALMKLDALG